MSRLLLALALAAGARAEDKADWRLVVERNDERVAINPADGTKVELKVGVTAAPEEREGNLLTVSHAASPDGKRIVYQMRKGVAPGRNVIAVADADGKNFRMLVEQHENVRPAWSADGKSIVFVSQREGVWHVWRIGVDGKDEKQVSREAVDSYCGACCAADGRVIYAIDRGRRGKLPLRDLVISDGDKDTVLVKENYVIAAAVSPDHRKLAIVVPGELIVRDLKAEASRTIEMKDVNANWVVVFYGALWRPDGQAVAVTFGFLGGKMVGTTIPGEDHVGVIRLDGEKPEIKTFQVGEGFKLKAWITAEDLNRKK